MRSVFLLHEFCCSRILPQWKHIIHLKVEAISCQDIRVKPFWWIQVGDIRISFCPYGMHTGLICWDVSQGTFQSSFLQSFECAKRRLHHYHSYQTWKMHRLWRTIKIFPMSENIFRAGTILKNYKSAANLALSHIIHGNRKKKSQYSTYVKKWMPIK